MRHSLNGRSAQHGAQSKTKRQLTQGQRQKHRPRRQRQGGRRVWCGAGPGRAARKGKVSEYRHAEKRKNIPPAKLAAEGLVPILPKIQYEYSPRLSPRLQFDPMGAPDALPELLEIACRRALTPEEARELAEALRRHEPWLEWAGKREARRLDVDPVALHIHERVSAQAILRVAARQDVERSLFADPQQE